MWMWMGGLVICVEMCLFVCLAFGVWFLVLWFGALVTPSIYNTPTHGS